MFIEIVLTSGRVRDSGIQSHLFFSDTNRSEHPISGCKNAIAKVNPGDTNGDLNCFTEWLTFLEIRAICLKVSEHVTTCCTKTPAMLLGALDRFPVDIALRLESLLTEKHLDTCLARNCPWPAGGANMVDKGRSSPPTKPLMICLMIWSS